MDWHHSKVTHYLLSRHLHRVYVPCAFGPRLPAPMKLTTPSAHLPTGLIRWVALLALLLLPACGRAKQQKPTVRKTQAADIVWCQIRGEEIRVPNKDAEEWAIRRTTFLHQTRELGSRRCFIRAYSLRQAEMKFSKGSQIPDPPAPPIVTDLVISERMLTECQAAGRNVAQASECRATKKGVKDKQTGEVGLTLFSIGEIQKVLQGLLQEQVSIRNLVVILETLGDFGGVTKDTAFLIEKVRQALSRQICLQYADEEKTLHVLTLDPALEQQIIDSRHDQVTGPVAALDPELARQWINAVTNAFRQVQNSGYYTMILSSEAARPLIKNSTLRDLPDLVVLSVPEVAPGIKVESVGDIRIGGK